MTNRGNTILSKVQDLIDPVTGEWDEYLVQDVFWPIDADRILQIPIFQYETEDYAAWHLTKSGRYTVKFVYYKQWEETYSPNSELQWGGQDLILSGRRFGR